MKRHAVTFLVELSLLVTFVIPGVAQSTTKARMIAIPLPQYPAKAAQRHIQGRGVFLLYMDMKTGIFQRAEVVTSTGSSLLDQAALRTFPKWRAAPGAIRVINTPIIFTLTGKGPEVKF